MKKVCLSLLALILLSLLFFTLFGDALYERGKPVVTAEPMKHFWYVFSYDVEFVQCDGFLPLEALRSDDKGDHVYVLSKINPFVPSLSLIDRAIVRVPPARGAYMRTTYTIHRAEVLETFVLEENPDMVGVTLGGYAAYMPWGFAYNMPVNLSDLIVVGGPERMEDKQRVLYADP
ncbi:MAG: hypothetical protein LBI19_05475 [Oscillospiraceae bacterium]|jgi:hypothetical protein|nr:hypothetical protein [Oscillospiraceae bacterium]